MNSHQPTLDAARVAIKVTQMKLHWPIMALALLISFTQSPPARADFESARLSYEEADFGTALAEFTPLAKRGDPKAQFYLGEMYRKGEGLTADPALAYAWYFKAAESGYGPAQLNVGAMLALGLGTERSYDDAYYWLIISGIWTEGATTRAAMAGLAGVASILSKEEKTAIEKSAGEAWHSP